MATRLSSLRPLALATGVTLLLVVPFGAMLLQEVEVDRGGLGSAVGPGPAEPSRDSGSTQGRAPEAGPAPTASGSLTFEPPPPREASSRPRPVVVSSAPVEPEVKEPAKPASVRMVALRRLERKRPAETVEPAEALVREVASAPEERTVLLSALGLLWRVPGGDAALLRLSDDPPTEEVGQLAAEYLMRPR